MLAEQQRSTEMDGDLIRMGDLRKLLANRSESAIRRDVREGNLPRPVKLGAINYWRKSEVWAHLKIVQEQQA